MPDEDKITNTNQPLTGGTPTVGQPDPTATPITSTPSPTAAPDISGQAIDTPPPPPMEDGAVSPPPPIVEEKKPEEATTPTQETGTTENTQTIPDIPPVITTSGTGGKKPVGKKMIATILGVLFLAGGIGAGVILVQKQQDIREEARSCTVGYTGTTGECRDGNMCRTYRFANCNTEIRCDGPACTASSTRYEEPEEETSSTTTSSLSDYDQCRADGNTPTECSGLSQLSDYDQCIADGNTPTECRGTQDPATSSPQPPNACDRSAPDVAPTAPDGYNNYCNDREIGASCYNRSGQEGTCQEIGDSSLGGTQVECKCEVGSAPVVPASEPTTRPTLPPGVTASCLNIQAFDAEWNSITTLSSLVAGDVVRFTVAGNASSGSFDKARFTINGTSRSEVSVKRPGTDEYYDEYTVPEEVTTFTINAEVHHTTLGWF